MSNNNSNRTYYDILGIDNTADDSTIRKAYLKLSLKYHPDKNPSDTEAAKLKFIEIGQAYEVLRDPTQRSIYDQELKRRQQRSNNSSSIPFSEQFFGNVKNNKTYDNYQDMFDATVGSMSEADLAIAIGAASAIGSLVGGMVGSRMFQRNDQNGSNTVRSTMANSLLSSVGSAIGSQVASEMAVSSVRALHRQSTERLQYKEECRRAVERGDPIPERNISNNSKLFSSDNKEKVKKFLWNKVKGSMESSKQD